MEEKQSTDKTEMTSILELSVKDFKAAIIKILEQAIRNNLAKKKRILQQILKQNRRPKKEPNGNFISITKKTKQNKTKINQTTQNGFNSKWNRGKSQ